MYLCLFMYLCTFVALNGLNPTFLAVISRFCMFLPRRIPRFLSGHRPQEPGPRGHRGVPRLPGRAQVATLRGQQRCRSGENAGWRMVDNYGFWMFMDGFWMFMDVSGCLWMVSGCLWMFMDGFWMFMDVSGWFLDVYGCFWMFMDGFWMFMDVSGCFMDVLWMFLVVYGRYLVGEYLLVN